MLAELAMSKWSTSVDDGKKTSTRADGGGPVVQIDDNDLEPSNLAGSIEGRGKNLKVITSRG